MTNFKDDAYYDGIDKRTKEYKQWAAFKQEQLDKQVKGVGDVVEKITEATGIKDAVKSFFNDEDCGCDKRRDLLNEKLPFRNQAVKCLEEEDYHYLKSFFSRTRDRIDSRNTEKLINIYNYVFGKNEGVPTCTNCPNSNFRSYVNRLHQYFMEAEKLITPEEE